MYGLENTSRQSSCTTDLGNFYAAVTMNGTNFSLRGAMHADNPDTAKIIYHLISGLMQQGIDAVPDKQAQSILKSIKTSARESEIVWEADVPEKVIADYFKPKPPPPPAATSKPAARPPARKKRTGRGTK